jgi:putative MATE family efflux protein
MDIPTRWARLQRLDTTQTPLAGAIGMLGLLFTFELAIHAVADLVEIFFVGRLGAASVSAITLSLVILNLPFSFFIQIGTALATLVAQYIGAQNRHAAAGAVGQALLLCACLCLPFSIVGVWLSPWLLRLIGADAAVVGAGTPYLRLGFAAMFGLLLPFVLNAALRAAGHAAAVTLIEILQTTVLVTLLPALILGLGPAPRLETFGAMLAVVVARMLAALFQLAYLTMGPSAIPLGLTSFRPDVHTLRRLLALSLPSTAQYLARYGADIAIARLVAGFGTTAIAGFAISHRLLTLLENVGHGLSNATFIVVGQNIGAKRRDRALRGTWIGVLYSLASVGVGSVVIAGLAPRLISRFNAELDVIELGASALRIIAATHVFSAVAWVITRSFHGAGDTVSPMVVDLVVLWAIQVPVALALAWAAGWETNGIWFGIALSQVVRAAVLLTWFYRRMRMPLTNVPLAR